MVRNLESLKEILNDQHHYFDLPHFGLLGITWVLPLCVCNKPNKF